MTALQLPSKQFLIRGAIATLIVAILLLAQTAWVRKLFHKSPLPPIATKGAEMNIGEAVGKDSNGNGIPDWEESLFGLDPTADGATNKKIIEEKRAALGATDQSTATLNQTDRVARQLFAVSAAGGTGGNSGDYGRAGAAIGGSVTVATVTNHYGIRDIQTVPTTSASMRLYHDALQGMLVAYPPEGTDIDLVVQDAAQGDFSNIGDLVSTGARYRILAEHLKVLRVPVALEDAALDMINGLYGMADSFDLLQSINQNGIPALAGFSGYRTYGVMFQNATAQMQKRFVQYGILSP